MHQRWEKLLFLHWTLNPKELQRTLPGGLSVDTWQGEAFVGITPFFMRNVRPPRLPSLAWVSNFQELNVRTYVKDRFGVPGIWFYSLDCNQPFAVIGARLFLCRERERPKQPGPAEASPGRYLNWRPHGDSNPGRYRERVMS